MHTMSDERIPELDEEWSRGNDLPTGADGWTAARPPPARLPSGNPMRPPLPGERVAPDEPASDG